ncbi:MAG: radical SAM protein [Selenomonadaceae bacterium]|nr:radical SAM protein [Selenomonadaceae bacterium]
MNYLFVMPRFVQNVGDQYIFPLGIAYVSAALKATGRNVYCLNLNLDIRNIDNLIEEYIKKYDISCIATAGLSPHFCQIRDFISYAKKIRPSIVSIVGGGLMTASPEVVMKGIPAADIGIINEGELTIQELAEHIENGNSLENVAGIYYRNQRSELVKTKPRKDIEDLDSLPFPDYDGFGFDGHSGDVTLCTSRSCPYQCAFCFHTCGLKYRSRSLDNIFKEIDWLVEKYDIKAVGILDELFSINNDKVNEFCRRIKNYNLKWSCQLRVDNIDLDTLVNMKEAGCDSISFGIESADNRVLKSMKKHITIEQVEYALDIAKKAKIQPFGNLLIGDIADDVESVRTNIAWFQKHPELNLDIIRTLILPGSSLYKYAVANGYIKDEVAYLERGEFAINITKMNSDEYKRCVALINEVKLNHEYLGKNLKCIRLHPEDHTISAECTCPSCGQEMNVRLADFFALENWACINCGQNFNLNLYQYYQNTIEENLQSFLESGGKIIIWGMGTVARRFAVTSRIFSHENIYLVDKSPLIYGTEMRGKKILNPETLHEISADWLLFGTSLLGKVGKAIPNTTVIEKIKENVAILDWKIAHMAEMDAFLFDIIWKPQSGSLSNI